MASTYSPNLRLELIGTGEQQGTWGITTNTNLGTLLEEAIGGYISVAVTDGADTTLTTNNGSADQSRNMVINLTGALTAARNVICPAIEKMYVVKNATTGGFAVTFKVSGQTGVSIPNGSTYILYVNGTDAVLATGTIAAQNSNNVSITGGSVTGITDLAVADGGTGASDAATARTNLGIGTIATQNSNNVSITGGSITGITDLAVADGGTGASTAAGAATNLGLGTGDSPQFAAVNIGNAADTTITRVSAGVIAVEGKTVVTETGGQTVQFAAGSNTAPSITTTGDTNTGIYFPAADTIAFTEGGTEAMRIDSSGNLGLGVTPSAWGAAYPGRIQGLGWSIATPLDGGTDTSAFATNAYNSSGGTWNYRNTASAVLYQQFTATHRWYTAPSGTAGNAITFTERMRIDSSGNVGIGTSSPTSRLHLSYATGDSGGIKLVQGGWNYTTRFGAVGSSGDDQYWVGNYNVAAATVDSSGEYTAYIRQNFGSGFISFGTSSAANAAPSERMRIDSSGNVGIGTSSPASTTKLAVGGNTPSSGKVAIVGDVGGVSLALSDNTNSSLYIKHSVPVTFGTDAGGALAFATNGFSERMRIDSSGNVGIGTSSPSQKLTVSVADTAQALQLRGATGYLRIRPYVDATNGTIIDSTNTAESAYAPLTLAGSSLRLFGGGGSGVVISSSGNVGIGTTTFGTSAATVLAIATGTAPSTGPADTIQIFSTDLSAGNTILSLRTEGTPVNANTTAAATHRIAVRINGTVYYLLANTAA